MTASAYDEVEPRCVQCLNLFLNFEELEIHFQAYCTDQFDKHIEEGKEMQCGEKGCGYEHERANIVAIHRKKAHGIVSEAAKNRKAKKNDVVDVNEDPVTVSAIRTVLKRKVKALRQKADKLEAMADELEGAF